MPTMLEVEPEVASKIQARARERGVSVDVYLRELIDQKGTESENGNGLSSQERVRLLREWASSHQPRWRRFVVDLWPTAQKCVALALVDLDL